MAETIVIEGRFNGPPQSAHGGYACGLLARHLDPNLAEVTLRSPPPLDAELQLRADGDSPTVRLFEDGALIAAAREIRGWSSRYPTRSASSRPRLHASARRFSRARLMRAASSAGPSATLRRGCA